MWEMQVLVGQKDGISPIAGEWASVCPSRILGVVSRPYRYEYKEDATRMIDKLYPDVPNEHKRIVEVK